MRGNERVRLTRLVRECGAERGRFLRRQKELL
jgi:hypothetical protein